MCQPDVDIWLADVLRAGSAMGYDIQIAAEAVGMSMRRLEAASRGGARRPARCSGNSR